MTANAAVNGADVASWVYLTLFALFFMVCMRLRGNMKFVGYLVRDVVTVKDRDSMFDETMRETSVIFFMLLLSGCSMGVLLLGGVRHFGYVLPDSGVPSLGLTASGALVPPFVCMGLACCYILAMWVGYSVVGRVFTDSQHTWAWVRGFTAGTGLASVLFFPLSLLSIAYPDRAQIVIIAALGVLIMVKFLFVIKGFRIFFTESSLWVVFLYYLCSLEIVPLVITFGLAKMMLG